MKTTKQKYNTDVAIPGRENANFNTVNLNDVLTPTTIQSTEEEE